MLVANRSHLSTLAMLRLPPHKQVLEVTNHEIRAHDDLDEFVTHIEAEFRNPLQTPLLKQTSLRLQDQFREKLDDSDICMLPAYSDGLPTGAETGEYLAADLGGSALRIARVRLHGRAHGKHRASEILRRWDIGIDEVVRALKGRAFFEWMGRKIRECLAEETRDGLRDSQAYHVMGLSWSFPLDHASNDSVRLLQMGKCFRAHEGLIGEDLGELIQAGCQRQGIDVRVRGIVNDGSACLLSQMYIDKSTTMAVILGTGLNAAIHLPATAFSPQKLAASSPSTPVGPDSSDILVDTEVSMFGKDAFCMTSWDETLNSAHPRPDFQPLEHLTSGRYLGEIVRLILVKASKQANMFGGELPRRFNTYELQTSTIAEIEALDLQAVNHALSNLAHEHPLPSGASFTGTDMKAMGRIIASVTDRAAAYMATSIHALWSLKQASSKQTLPENHDDITISCFGSVLGKYPRFRERVQTWLDEMTAEDAGSLHLQMADEGEGALTGAAVAVALHLRKEAE